ncbi:MAG: glycoside hydrolase family 2 TIM barrel-domain containing protein [Fimbriimonadales bacterium]
MPPLVDAHSSRRVATPQVWEDRGVPKTFDGSRVHTIHFNARPQSKRRYWLHFGGVSYEAIGWLNGTLLGTHRGIWDSFTWEATEALRTGRNRLEVQVERNGTTRFPVPEVLSGFLPYVSCPFGGIWQPIWLFETGETWLSDVWARGNADGNFVLTVHLEGKLPAVLDLKVHSWDGKVLYHTALHAESEILHHEAHIEGVQAWSPKTPHLYRCTVEVYQAGERSHCVEQSFGFRTVAVEGSTILLNGEPFYPRGLLHWGWYVDTHAPNPSLKNARTELQALQKCGFNLLKACLWVPPEAYLDLCDRMGVAVWLELPLWLPRMNAEQIRHTVREYERIVRQVRHHPSIIIWTLGCELSTRFPSEALSELYQLVKHLTGSPLIRDNSGGGECYGGAVQEYADFADYHLYGDPHFARLTFRSFLDTPRPKVPWLQGEFCDHDTLRDYTTLRQKLEQKQLWWIENDPERNPQGVRWFYETPFVEERLNRHKVEVFANKLVQSSRREQLAHHKLVLEVMRALEGTSGYVVTALKDTPIITSGLLDELGELKTDPHTYRTFNADTVILLDWHRRRIWHAGGDRPAYPDSYNHFGGRTIYPILSLSHFGKTLHNLVLEWRCGKSKGQIPIPSLPGGEITHLPVLSVQIPQVSTPTRIRFEAHLKQGRTVIARNYWDWRIYPPPDWQALSRVSVYDPQNQLIGLPSSPNLRPVQSVNEIEGVLLSTRWNDALHDWVASGGEGVLLVREGCDLPTEALPFWRESCHLCLDHPLWEQLPRPDGIGITEFAFSTDKALKSDAMEPLWDEWNPIWRRVDTRTGYVHDYLGEAQCGKGHLLITTLHFAGSHGETPVSLWYHPAGQYWLWQMLAHYSLSSV